MSKRKRRLKKVVDVWRTEVTGLNRKIEREPAPGVAVAARHRRSVLITCIADVERANR